MQAIRNDKSSTEKGKSVRCHSFVRMAKLAAPPMTDGGTMFAMSYYGAEQGGRELHVIVA